MAKKTIEIQEYWIKTPPKLLLSEDPGPPNLLLQYPFRGDPTAKSHGHVVPFDALAHRMELLGLATEKDSLDHIIKEANGDEIPDEDLTWQELVADYFQTAHDYAKDSFETLSQQTVALRDISEFSLASSATPGEVLMQNSRDFLRSAAVPAGMMNLRTSADLSGLSSKFKERRGKRVDRLRNFHAEVSVTKNDVLGKIHVDLTKRSEDISLLADRHAGYALRESGASLYAYQLDMIAKERRMIPEISRSLAAIHQ